MPRISRWNHTPAFKSEVASVAITGLLKKHGASISMDGKGSWRFNIFLSRR